MIAQWFQVGGKFTHTHTHPVGPSSSGKRNFTLLFDDFFLHLLAVFGSTTKFG
jgi:hypothetical protein